MKKNKFMTRVFSAMENQETEVLDQIQNDLEIAKEDGELDSEEYKITWDPDQEVFVLHDKINNEHTEISEDEEAAFYMTDMTDANEGIPTPEESIPELSVNDEVKWTDELGHDHQGMITMISDGIATILENEVEVAAPIESLMKVEAPVEEVTEVEYTFSEKVEDYEFSFVEKEFGNSVRDDIPEGISSKLQDLAQTTGCIDYSDIMKMQYTPEKGRKINYLYRVLQEKGELTEKQCKNLKEIVNSVKSFSSITKSNTFKRAASQWARDLNLGQDGIKLITAAFEDVDEYFRLQEKLKVSPRDMMKFDTEYYDPEDDKVLFSNSKSFSHIDSPESFREYAHKVMKEAHGDEYSEEVTNKVVDDLLADNPNSDYGELIGRLTSGFGEKEFSFIEKTFAKSDEVKKLEFEVSRIKDLYDDVKARQKGETDPVMKSRNKMLLQEIKVKLEQAKLAVYKKEFEESRSKNFSFVEKTFSKGKICLVYDEESDNYIAKNEESAKELAEKALGNFIVKTFESRDQLNDYISRGDYRRVGRNRWVGGENGW